MHIITAHLPGSDFSVPVCFARFSFGRCSVTIRFLFGHHSVHIWSPFGRGISAVRRDRLQGAWLRLGETAGEAHARLPVDGRGEARVQPQVCPGSEDAPALQGLQVSRHAPNVLIVIVVEMICQLCTEI